MAGSAFSDGYLNSVTVARCFDAPALLVRMLEFESALAQTQADLGFIPDAAAACIAAQAAAPDYDLEQLRLATAEASNPAIPLVRALTARVAAKDAEAARYVHWGSTSQDVMDSAVMLCCRDALRQIDDVLGAISATLCTLADEHRGTMMVVRTLSQHAAPGSFAGKVATWLNGLLNVRLRLAALNAGLPLQFGGASGTLAAFDTRGAELAAGVARRLGLNAIAPWHTERSVVRELAAALGELAATCGKIAGDIVLMAQTEVGELREAAAVGRGGSSALPHKRNPVAAIAVCASARRAPGLLATVYAAFDHWHERAAGAWHAENAALCDLFVVSAGAAEQLDKSLTGIEVDRARMRANLDLTRGLVMSEAVVMALAPALGRGAAQDLVKGAVVRAESSATALGDILAADEIVCRHLDAEQLRAALDPNNFLGVSTALVEQVLARAATIENASSKQARTPSDG